MWFCDWLTGRLPFRAAREINGGYVRVTGPGGQVEYTTVRRLSVRGSFEDTMEIRSAPGGYLEFSGSPAKFVLGHNLYGANGVESFAAGLGLTFAGVLGVNPEIDEAQRWLEADVPLTRIDITRMYRPEWAEPGWVSKWLAIAGTRIQGGHQKVTPASAYAGETIYVGKGSRRISMKLYDKAKELRKHPPRIYGEGSAERLEELLSYAADTLRVEVQIRSLELKERGLERLRDWSVEKGDAIMDERIAKLSLADDVRMTEEAMEYLPRPQRQVYRLWRAGDDLRKLYSRAQFYRHRKALLAHGIDIAHVQPHVVVTEREYSMGRPLKDYLAGGGLEPPASAIERGELSVG